MLPKPALSFTIPSIHDTTPLDCRVYHPPGLHGAGPRVSGDTVNVEVLSRRDHRGRRIWRRKAAIVAHPYAPLGGCYDDPVVAEIIDVLLREGWIVGTFNFRGAYGSKGSTSWTAKPELEDYKSFVGFMAYYMHHLQPPSPATVDLPGVDVSGENKTSVSNGESVSDLADSHLLLLAGYSYGSLITTSLPPTDTIIETNFRTPELGSAAYDIRLRAQHLAMQQNEVWKFVHKTVETENSHPRGRHPHPGESHRVNLGGSVRIGGEESLESMRRASRESRRSVDSARLRRSLERVKSLGKHHAGSSTAESHIPTSGLATARPISQGSDSTSSIKHVNEGLGLVEPEGLASTRTCYLLISPLQGMVKSLLFMSFMEKMRTRDQILAKEEHRKLVFPNSTLALYGDQDGFSNLKKQRSWMELMGPEADLPLELGFKSKEISGAGHFWRERGVMGQMKGHLLEWLRALQK